MPEALHDFRAVSAPIIASRKRPRQDSDCNIEADLDGSGISGGSTNNHYEQEEERNANGRSGGSQKRARSENHSEEDLTLESSAWGNHPSTPLDSSSSRQLNTNRSPGRSPLESFIPLPVSPSPALTSNESRGARGLSLQTAEQGLARSMEFDQHLDALRRSPNPAVATSTIIEHIPAQGNTLVGEDMLIRDITQEGTAMQNNEEMILDDAEPSELVTSRGDESITTRRLRFADMPPILASRVISVDPVGRTSSSHLAPDNPSHIFERTQSPPLSESSSVVAARSHLGLVRNPDLIARGQRMRDQLLRWRSISRSPASFGDHSEAVLNSSSSSRNMTTGPANDMHIGARTADISSPSTMSPISRTSSIIPEPPSRHSSVPRQSDFFQEMREIFEPFEPFSFDEHQGNQDSSAPPLPPGIAGNGQRVLTRHRPSGTRDEARDGLSDLYHGNILESNGTLESHNNTGVSSMSRSSHFWSTVGSPQIQNMTARFVDTPEETLWHEASTSSTNTPDDRRDRETSETQREIRRLTTLVDELQESIRVRPSTIQPPELQGNGADQTFRRRSLRASREPPRRALIDEDYPLPLPPLPSGNSSNGRSTSRSLLDPSLSIGLSSSSSSSSRQSWASTSERDYSRFSSATQARSNSRIPPPWNTDDDDDDDDDTDTDLFDFSWSSGIDRPRPLSSLFSGTGHHSALSRSQQASRGRNSSNSEPIYERLPSNRTLYEFRPSFLPRRPQVPPPEPQRRSHMDAAALLQDLRASSPSEVSSLLAGHRRSEMQSMLERRSLLRDLPNGEGVDTMEDNIPESSTRGTLSGLEPPPRPVEPRIPSLDIGLGRLVPRIHRSHELPRFPSYLGSNNHSLAEERITNATLEPSRGHTSSVSPTNRCNWLRGSENDSLPPGLTFAPHRRPSHTSLPSERPRESSPDRLSRHNFGFFRTSGESLSDLIRRRTARVDAVPRSSITTSDSSSRRSPSPGPLFRTMAPRLPRPPSLFGNNDLAARPREMAISPDGDQEVVIPDNPSRSLEHIEQDRRNSGLFEPPAAPRFENSYGDTRLRRRSYHRRTAEFVEEPVIPPRPANMPVDLIPEPGTLRAARERTQLREAISRRGRQDETNPHRLISSTFERTRSLIHRDPLSDEPTRTLERRLRESEAEMSRALQALDRWGELEATTERELDTAPSRPHRFGETVRRRRHSNGFPFSSNNDISSFSGESNSTNANRLSRRSPSPLALAPRHQSMQTRWARAQNHFRELSETQGEHSSRPPRSRNTFLDFAALRTNRASHRELEDYFRPRRIGRHIDGFNLPFNPSRNIGDYVRDEDFDSSYENLIRLASIIGDAKPRGTPGHLIASLPTGFYKDFRSPDCDTRCPICLDDYKDLDPVLRISDCDHWFHKDCLEQWLKNARTCPLCKATVRGRKRSQREEQSPTDDASGSSRRQDDDDSDSDGSEPGPDPRRGGSPGLTLDELSTFANSSW